MSARDTVVGGIPTVQLLPPEVGQRARAAGHLRLAVTVLVLVAVVAGLGFGWSFWQNLQAQAELAAARDETTRLLTEQQEYADVQAALGIVTDVGLIEQAATQYEVEWSARIEQIAAASPVPALFMNSITLTVTPPWRAPNPSTNALAGESRGQIAFTIATATSADAAAFVRAVEELDWVAGVRVTSVQGGDPVISNLVVVLGNDVYWGRFGEQPEGAEAPDDATGEDAE